MKNDCLSMRRKQPNQLNPHKAENRMMVTLLCSTKLWLFLFISFVSLELVLAASQNPLKDMKPYGPEAMQVGEAILRIRNMAFQPDQDTPHCSISRDVGQKIWRVAPFGIEKFDTDSSDVAPAAAGTLVNPAGLTTYTYNGFNNITEPTEDEMLVALKPRDDDVLNEGPLPWVMIAPVVDDNGDTQMTLKVKMGINTCILYHDAMMTMYCNGELVSSPTVGIAQEENNFRPEDAIPAIIDNNQYVVYTLGSALFVTRLDTAPGSIMIVPTGDGWEIYHYIAVPVERKKRLIVTIHDPILDYLENDMEYSDPPPELYLGLCSYGSFIDLKDFIRIPSNNTDDVFQSFIMENDGDQIGNGEGGSFGSGSGGGDGDGDDGDDGDEEPLEGADTGGYCPIDVTTIESTQFKKICKTTKKTFNHCNIFKNTAGPLAECMASSSATLMFNAAAAYEECKLAVCARMPKKTICRIVEQHVKLCISEHENAAGAPPENAIWRSETGCLQEKIPKRGDENGEVKCVNPRTQRTCWNPEGCNYLLNVEEELPQGCDERMVCNKHYYWNGRKCVFEGKC